ncbi:MAG TPA: hypothetical protein VLM37_01785 [Fibrobacteraceae bacterium]|nr:hypothetical protein [Fibrobacteraceae bacterium]
MNISKMLLAFGLLASASMATKIWDATDAVGQLQGDDYDGYWYTFTDEGDDGNSTISPWLEDSENATYDWIGEYIQDSCNSASLCAVMTLGSAIDYPYVDVGVNFLDPQAETDMSSNYVCFSYTASQAWRLNLGLSTTNEAAMGYNVPGWEMKKATARTTVSKAFSSATQQSGWGTEITVSDYLGVVEALKFHYSGSSSDAGTANNLNIYDLAIASSDCSGEVGDVAIKWTAGQSAFQAALNGSVLTFSGLGSKTMNVEAINLQGQVIAHQAISSSANTLDLSKAPRGVMIVRATSAGVSYNKMFTLK